MLDKVFGKFKIHSYCRELEELLPGSIYINNGEEMKLTIPCSLKKIEIDFGDVCNVKEARDRFSYTVTNFVNEESNFLIKAEIINWYKNLPEKLKEKDRFIHTSIKDDLILENPDYLAFFREMKDCFEDMIMQEYSFIGLRVKLPMFDDVHGVDISIEHRDNFIEDFVNRFVTQCVNLNAKYSLDYQSSDKLRDGFSKMLELPLSNNTKNMIKEAIEALPYTRNDYIAIYIILLEKKEKDCFDYNTSKICNHLETLINTYEEGEPKKEELERLLVFLQNIEYRDPSQLNTENYKKAENIARLMGYKPEVFEERDDIVTFPENTTAIIGEYFRIEKNGGIMPNFEKFESLPKEFFEVVERIKERDNEQELNIDFSY